MLLLGVGMFLFAMWWDSSDRARLTRRSDVAFWLHLLAAPMIAHPVFTLLGVTNGTLGVGEAIIVLVLYILLGLTALAVDRRALLVSALAYVLYALTELFKQFGAVELNIALTALVIGSALLLLSAFWHQARRAVVTALPSGFRTACRTSTGSRPNQPHEPPLERGQDTCKVVAPLQQLTLFTDQRERPLLQPKRGAFFDAHFRALGVPAIGREDCDVGIDAKRIIPPVAGGDHPPVEIEDSGPFDAVETGNRAPVPWSRERRDDAQALLTFGRGWQAALKLATSLRSSSISLSSSPMRARTGSTSSPHGVP